MDRFSEYVILVSRYWYVLFIGFVLTILSAVTQGTSGLPRWLWVVLLVLTFLIANCLAFGLVAQERDDARAQLAQPIPSITARAELMDVLSINGHQLLRLRVHNDGPRTSRLMARVEELNPPHPHDPEPPWPVPWRGADPVECLIPDRSSEILKVATVKDVDAATWRARPDSWRPNIACLLPGPEGDEAHPAYFRDFHDDGFLGSTRSLRLAIRDSDDGRVVASGWVDMQIVEVGPAFLLQASLRDFA